MIDGKWPLLYLLHNPFIQKRPICKSKGIMVSLRNEMYCFGMKCLLIGRNAAIGPGCVTHLYCIAKGDAEKRQGKYIFNSNRNNNFIMKQSNC